jgi:hypothetical protein
MCWSSGSVPAHPRVAPATARAARNPLHGVFASRERLSRERPFPRERSELHHESIGLSRNSRGICSRHRDAHFADCRDHSRARRALVVCFRRVQPTASPAAAGRCRAADSSGDNRMGISRDGSRGLDGALRGSVLRRSFPLGREAVCGEVAAMVSIEDLADRSPWAVTGWRRRRSPTSSSRTNCSASR